MNHLEGLISSELLSVLQIPELVSHPINSVIQIPVLILLAARPVANNDSVVQELDMHVVLSQDAIGIFEFAEVDLDPKYAQKVVCWPYESSLVFYQSML